MTSKAGYRSRSDAAHIERRERAPYARPRLEIYGDLANRTEAKLSYMFDEGFFMTNDMS